MLLQDSGATMYVDTMRLDALTWARSSQAYGMTRNYRYKNCKLVHIECDSQSRGR